MENNSKEGADKWKARRGARPADRISHDTLAFMQDEKFETWLDLRPLIVLRETSRPHEVWEDVDLRKVSHVFSKDSMAMLRGFDMKPSDLGYMIVTPCLPALINGHVLKTTIKSCHMKSSVLLEFSNTTRAAALESVKYQIQHLLSGCSPSLYDKLHPSADVWDDKLRSLPREVYSSLLVAEDMLQALAAYRCLSEFVDQGDCHDRAKARIASLRKLYCNKNGSLKLPSLGATILLTPDVLILDWDQHRFLLSHKSFLELVNKVVELHNGLFYAHLQSGTILHDDFYLGATRFWSHITCFVGKYCSFDHRLTDLSRENKGFTYLKMMEALGVSYMITVEDGRKKWNNTLLGDTLWSSAYADHLVFSEDVAASDLTAIFMMLGVAGVAELIGTIKIAGHPSIEVDNGLEKLFSRVQAPLKINRQEVDRITGVLKRDLIIAYRKKRGKYPLLTLTRVPPQSNIRRLMELNLHPGSAEGVALWKPMSPEDWLQVDIEKNEDFDPIDNQLKLLKDKALGLVRSKVMQLILLEDKFDLRTNLGRIEDRRSLLKFLLHENFDQGYSQYMESYTGQFEWSDDVLDYLVIKLTPKELEEKPEGRYFGASPLEERNRRVAQEENAMRMLDEYSEEQLMTPDELTMINKLYSFRYFNQMYPGHTLLQVSFDFSKWNNNMRHDSVDVPAAATLDKWFGTRLYGKTMKAYENMFVYYRDSLTERHWTGQAGGIEGLNQATWSYVFIGGIKQALEGLGIVYQLTVKGDDVRAAIVIPQHQIAKQGLNKIRTSILNQLQTLCHNLGWQLNPQECFVSLSLIATSKQYQINDTFMMASQKKMIKVESLTNVIFPTTEDIVAGAFSTAHSAASQATVVLPAFVHATYTASKALYRDLHPKKPLTLSQLVALLLWPQCLGGPGSLPLQTFLVRGENDLLSISLSLFRNILMCGKPDIRGYLINILSQPMSGRSDHTLLLSDPYAIPLSCPERSSSVMKRLLRRSLPRWVKNPDLKILLSTESELDKEAFVEHLISMRPFYVKVLVALMECSPFYVIDEVLGKFMQSSTVFAFFARGAGGHMSKRLAHRCIRRIMMSAQARRVYWLSLLKDNLHQPDIWLGVDSSIFQNDLICTTEIVHHVRKACWNLDFKGITYPSLIDQNRFFTASDFHTEFPGWDITTLATPIIIHTKTAKYQTSDRSLHYAAIDGMLPWLGSRTSAKLELPSVKTKIISTAIQKVMKLLSLKINCVVLGHDFEKTVDMCIRGLTTKDMSRLNVLVPESGSGHISHRVATNSYSMNTMPNMRPNLSQLVKITEDAGAALRGDIVNRTVNFAARHFLSVIISLFPLQSSIILPAHYPDIVYTCFHWEEKALPRYSICPYCCCDVDDVQVKFSVQYRPNLTFYSHLPLVGCSPFESRVLEKNIAEATDGKVRRMAESEFLSGKDPELLTMATRVLISKLSATSKNLDLHARSQGYFHIPQPRLLEMLSASQGTIKVHKVSKNILRIMTPENLYHSLFGEMINFVLEWVGVEGADDLIYTIDNLMPHLNPLAGVFTHIMEAGLLDYVRIGARTSNQVVGFTWTAGSLQSGSAAMKAFVSAHMGLIIQWLQGKAVIRPIVMFSNQEPDKVALTHLRYEYRKIMKGIYNRLNKWEANHKMMQVMYRYFQQIDRGWKQGLTEQYGNHAVASFINEGFDLNSELGYAVYRICRRMLKEVCALISVSHAMVVERLYFILMLDEFITMGEELVNPNLITDSTQPIVLCGLHMDELREVTKRGMTPEPEYSQQFWPKCYTPALWPTLYLIVRCELLEIEDHLLETLCSKLTELERWVSPISEWMVGFMRQDDAERLLKEAAGQVDSMIQKILQPDDLENLEEDATPVEYQAPKCLMGHDLEHRDTLNMVPSAFSSTHRIFTVPSHINISGLIPTVEEPAAHQWIDPLEIGRCSGIHNTSGTKYKDVLSRSGASWALDKYQKSGYALCLADGLGGLTAMLLDQYNHLAVFYNSLYYSVLTGKTAADAEPQHMPMEASCLPGTKEVQSRLIWKGPYPGDLTLPSVRQVLVANTSRCSRNPLLITCDADIIWSDDFQSARSLWFGVLHVMAQVGDRHTINVIKIFLVNHDVVLELIHSVLMLYNHVHIYRSRYTRQKSTEAFLVFSTPRSSYGTSDKVNSILNRDKGYCPSYMAMSFIAAEYQRISSEYSNFRVQGLGLVMDLRYLLMRLVRQQAYPLLLSAGLSTLGLTLLNKGFCLCGLWDLLAATSRSQEKMMIKAMSEIQEMLSGRKSTKPKAFTAKHMLYAVGWRHVFSVSRRLCRIITLKTLSDYMSDHFQVPMVHLPADLVYTIYDQVIEASSVFKSLFRLARVQGHLISVNPRCNDDWTILIQLMIRKFLQIIGSLYLCMMWYHIDPDKADERCSFFSTLLRTNVCCSHTIESICGQPEGWHTEPQCVSGNLPDSIDLPTFDNIPSHDDITSLGILLDPARKPYQYEVGDVDPNLREEGSGLYEDDDDEATRALVDHMAHKLDAEE